MSVDTTVTVDRELIPVLDPTGAVEKWIADGRGVKVWTCKDLGSSMIGSHAFTPGDTEERAGWRYGQTPDEVLTSADAAGRLVFYRKAHVIAAWSDTPAGWKAAYRFSERLWRDAEHYQRWEHTAPAPSPYIVYHVRGRRLLIDRRSTWMAPIGRIYQTWTVERHTYRTEETVAFPLYSGTDVRTRPLDSESRVCVVSWSAMAPIQNGETEGDAQ